jgi:alpha-tubulin suppressor-like RCC1 family protein
VAAGLGRVCGIRAGGTLWCWGAETTVPTQVGTADDWTSIDVGDAHCGLRARTDLWCWGNNGLGQVGIGSEEWWVPEPTRVRPDLSWSAVATGFGHTCGIGQGAMYCWGWNGTGQLGQGYVTDPEEPGALVPLRVGLATDWVRVDAGGSRSCAIRHGGRLYCWGNGSAGDGSGAHSNDVPTLVDLDRWATVSVGELSTLGIRLV